MRKKTEILQGMKERFFIDKCGLDLKFWSERVFDAEVKDFHLEWMDLVNNNRFVALQAFRGSGKTTILGVIYPLWLAYYRPGTHILFTAAELAQATKILDEVKEVIENNEFLNELMPPNPSTWKKTELKMTNGSRIFCKAYTRHIKGIHVDYAFCVNGRTLINTSLGCKEIKDVRVGDDVLTHKGRFRKVKKLYKRRWSGKIYWINTPNSLLKITGEHPVLVRYKNNRVGWKKTKNLSVDDILLFSCRGTNPVVRMGIRHFVLNNDHARLFGLYLAEGCCSSNMVRLTFGKDETDLKKLALSLLTGLFGLKCNIDSHLPWADTVYGCNKSLSKKFGKWFGTKSIVKIIPYFMFKANTQAKANFVYGWLQGDGHFNKNGGANGYSASPELIKGMRLLLNSLGCKYKVYENITGSEDFGKRLMFSICISKPSLGIIRDLISGIKKRNYCEVPISHIKVKRCCSPVYNLEVEEDNSYVANGCVVHNCDELQDCFDREVFNKAIGPTVNKKQGHLVGVGASDNPGDLLEELFHRPGYVGRRYPVLIEPGVSRWPEAFPMSEIEAIRKRDGEESFQTQYMLNAKAEREGAVFPLVWIDNCFDFNESFGDKKYDESTCVIGADFAIAQGPRADFDAYVVLEKISGKTILRFAERHKGLPKDAKEQRLNFLFQRFNPHRIIMDPSHIGEAILQDLRNQGLPVTEGEFHAKARHKLLVNLQMMMQPDKNGNSELVIPRNPEDSAALTFTNKLIEEMIGFKEEKSLTTGMTSYISKARHDDTVMALALACKAASEQREFLDIVAV